MNYIKLQTKNDICPLIDYCNLMVGSSYCWFLVDETKVTFLKQNTLFINLKYTY